MSRPGRGVFSHRLAGEELVGCLGPPGAATHSELLGQRLHVYSGLEMTEHSRKETKLAISVPTVLKQQTLYSVLLTLVSTPPPF